MWHKLVFILQKTKWQMENKTNSTKTSDLELLETMAFRMGKSPDVQAVLWHYADTAEECECFSF